MRQDNKELQIHPRRSSRKSPVSWNGLKILSILVLAVVLFMSLFGSYPSRIDEDSSLEKGKEQQKATTSSNNKKDQKKKNAKDNKKSKKDAKDKKKKDRKTEKKKTKTITKDTKSVIKLDSSAVPKTSNKDNNVRSQEDLLRFPNGIRQISILGERNSGTRWTWDHVSACFNHSIPVVKNLTRYKHWFQYPNESIYPHDTLVLAQFRNPFDWLKAMQHVPHHAPLHYNLTWKQFLTTPWTMPRMGTDLTISNPHHLCQEEFLYKDLVSCAVEPLPKEAYDQVIRYSAHQPFYEMNMDGSGRPYDNILQFRSDKIVNFLSVKDYPGVADVWVIQYEYLLAKGTAHLLDLLQQYTGVTPRCQPFPRQYRPSRPVTKAFAKYINRHLNWTTEAWIGYATDIKREEKWE